MSFRITDKRRINLKKELSKDNIPFLEGRPKRDLRIQHGDIMDLRILLNTSKSLEELFEQV